MPMSARLLRPIRRALAGLAEFILTTLGGDPLTDHTGDPLRTIQDA